MKAYGGASLPGVKVELVNSLPGGRAVACVEQESGLIWLASREHVSQQAVEEIAELAKIFWS